MDGKEPSPNLDMLWTWLGCNFHVKFLPMPLLVNIGSTPLCFKTCPIDDGLPEVTWDTGLSYFQYIWDRYLGVATLLYIIPSKAWSGFMKVHKHYLVLEPCDAVAEDCESGADLCDTWIDVCDTGSDRFEEL